jgi:hypothetical protein
MTTCFLALTEENHSPSASSTSSCFVFLYFCSAHPAAFHDNDPQKCQSCQSCKDVTIALAVVSALLGLIVLLNVMVVIWLWRRRWVLPFAGLTIARLSMLLFGAWFVHLGNNI